jgi:hypothetical protein
MTTSSMMSKLGLLPFNFPDSSPFI